MKKSLLLIITLVAFFTAQAQWSPSTNNFIANTSTDAGEIYLSTDDVSGDTYVQWMQFASNNWSPTLQRLSFNGTPQWGENGLHIGGQAFSSWSQGVAMTATNDGGVVSCFSNEEGQSYAVRINANGSFPWGEAGVMLFGGLGGTRTEVMAGTDGGVWALGTDMESTYVQYVNADGTLNPMITINEAGTNCTFGLMVPANNNGVFVVYEKENWAYTYYYSKEIWVRGYNIDGTPFSENTQLMAEQVMVGAYVHYVVPDGLGGGYVYLWHAGIGDAYNTYVFHFNANGASTIMDLNGIPVHTGDPAYYYLSAAATVDPESHDLIIGFEETDSDTESICRLYFNRISTTGDKIWGDNGMMFLDNGTNPCGGIRVDAYEYEPGFSVIFHRGVGTTGYQSIVEAKGFDLNGNNTWNTTLCSNAYPKTGDQNSTGFHQGQNIVAWVNSSAGGLYGQNVGVNGTMGQIIPPIPPSPCLAPSEFDGAYEYHQSGFGVYLKWAAPEELPLFYNLYRKNLNTGDKDRIVVDANANDYFDEVGIGDYQYWLTAFHEDCESDPALTPYGDAYLLITVTSVDENTDEEIITVTNVFTMNGQQIRNVRIEDLSRGIYIIQGLTASGKLICRKTVVE